jgi:hypothetical protein
MPGATHGLTDDQAFRERTGIVSAGRADRVDGRAFAHQHDCVIAHVAEQRHVLREFGYVHTRRQVGSTRLFGLSHVISLLLELGRYEQ